MVRTISEDIYSDVAQIRRYNTFDELGRIGQKKYAGVFYEEFLPELQGRRGAEAYEEMANNDDIIGAILFAIEMLIRQVEWNVEPRGSERIDQEAADFVRSCMDDMEQSWQDTLSEILSFLTYGWSYHEIVYKRRMGKSKNVKLNSKYDDGLIGWRELPIRAQDTLWRWEYDKDDHLVGMTQTAPPDFAVRTIPIEKALHFVTKSRKGNPEGRSILRNCYRAHYFKRRFQEIEGIGVERDLAGLPVIQPPENFEESFSDEEKIKQLTYAAELVRNVRRNEQEGIIVPSGWTFSLLAAGGRRQFEVGTIIERYDNRMAMTVLADFVLLGHQMHGSYALSSDKTELFSVAIGTYLDIICGVFNTQAIPRLIDLNAEHFSGITDYPKMLHGDIEKPDIEKVASFVEKMTSIGILNPDPELEKHIRRLGDLPEALEGTEYPPMDDEDGEEEEPDKKPGDEE